MSLSEDEFTLTYNALRHPTRRKILKLLSKRSKTYTEIMNELDLDKGLLNYHLENLLGLIKKDKEDKYTLSNAGWSAIDLDKSLEVRVLDEKFRVFGMRLNPTILLVASVLLVVLSSSLILAYQKQTTEVVKLKTMVDELLSQNSGLNNELRSEKELQDLTLNTYNPNNNLEISICSRYWLDVKSTSRLRTDVSSARRVPVFFVLYQLNQ